MGRLQIIEIKKNIYYSIKVCTLLYRFVSNYFWVLNIQYFQVNTILFLLVPVAKINLNCVSKTFHHLEVLGLEFNRWICADVGLYCVHLWSQSANIFIPLS